MSSNRTERPGRHADVVRQVQVGPDERGRAAHVAAAVHEQVRAVRGRDVGRDRRAAAGVDEPAEVRAPRHRVAAVELQHVRPIGGEPPGDVERCRANPTAARRGPTRGSRSRRDGRRSTTCCCATGRAATARRRRDLVRRGEARVVAPETAQRVVGAEEPVPREAAVVAELERVVRSLRPRRGKSRRASRPSGIERTSRACPGCQSGSLRRLGRSGSRCPRSSRADRCGRSARSRRRCRPTWKSAPKLVLDCFIGSMSGSISSSNDGTRRSRQLPGLLQMSVPGMFERLRLPRSSVFEAAIVDAPRLGAERSARKLVFGPVVVEPPAAEQLDAPVAVQVVRGAQPRRELVAETELEGRLEEVRTERRDSSRSRSGARGST